MYTVEDIRGAAFAREFRGYSIEEVDDFIDQCADTVQELQRQNAENAKKLEILTERLMEYRREEDSIHTALLTAQRAGDAMLREAQQKADLTLQDADIKAEKAHENMTRAISIEQLELERVRADVTKFKAELLELYREHVLRIQEMPQFEIAESEPEPEPEPEPEVMDEPAPAVAEEEPDTVEEGVLEEAVAEEETPAEEEAEEVELEDMEEEEEIEDDGEPKLDFEPLTDIFSNSDEEESDAAPTDSKFADLQFGPDYEIGDNNKHFFKRK